MAHLQLVDRDPSTMSRRARVYITAGGSRHLLIGFTMVAFPWLYSSAAFIPIFNLFGGASIQVWAWTMIVVGTVCLAGAIVRNPNVARAGMVGSAVVTLVLAAGLTIGVADVWWTFSRNLHPGELHQLILDRPQAFPAEIARRVLAPPSPFLPLLLLSVTVKDFTMVAQPLRVPLEDRRRRPIPRTV